MRQKMALVLGTLMIAGGLLGASISWDASVASADTPARSATHDQMHALMNRMMGEGFFERMHAAMPGSEEMMEACAGGMGGMMSGTDTMMQQLGGR